MGSKLAGGWLDPSPLRSLDWGPDPSVTLLRAVAWMQGRTHSQPLLPRRRRLLRLNLSQRGVRSGRLQRMRQIL